MTQLPTSPPAIVVTDPRPTRRRRGSTAGWLLLAVLLTALNLRIGITSLGAVLDTVGRTTHLPALMVSFATSLPVLCFALVGAVGGAVTRRLGAQSGLGLAMLLLGVGLAARVSGGGWTLLAGTFVACAGIALANVLLPTVVKAEFPTRLGEVTGAYTAALSLGAALGASATVPLSVAAGSWRAGLGVWAVVAVVALVAWVPHRSRARAEPADAGATRLWTRGRAWAVTGLFATQSVFAYVQMGWLPSMYADAGFSAKEAGLFLAGSVAIGVPVYFVVPTFAARLRSQGHLVAGLTGAVAAGLLGLWALPSTAPLLWAALLGIGGGVFPVTLTMFALRTRSAPGTAALSAMAQSVGYLLAAAGPLLVGQLRFATGSWAPVYAALLVVCVGQVVLGYLAGRPGFVDEPSS